MLQKKIEALFAPAYPSPSKRIGSDDDDDNDNELSERIARTRIKGNV